VGRGGGFGGGVHPPPRDDPWRLDSRLLRRHFSAELIASETARERPLAPDLRPLPAR